MHHFFEVNNPSVNVGGNTGQIVQSDNHDIEVFIPDLSAAGPNHDWILTRFVGTAGWSNLGQITLAQSPRQFTWQFQNDSNHKPGRTWTQVGPSLWTEVYQSGMHHFFEVNNPSVNVGGNTGQIVESDNHDIEVFIPDLSATGPNHDWILARNVGTAGWSNLGQITPAQ
jgi:hypothetical protein